MWAVTDGASVVGGEVGCFEHASGTKRVCEYGNDVIVQVKCWLCVFWGVGCNDVLKQWGLWFAVEQGSGSGINVSVRGDIK